MARIKYEASEIPSDAIVIGANHNDDFGGRRSFAVNVPSDSSAEDQVWSSTSTRSLYNLAPEVIKRGMDAILEVRPALAEIPMEQIQAEVAGELAAYAKLNAQQDISLDQLKTLRMTLWEEYGRAVANRTLMYLDKIVRGVCSPSGFYTAVCSQPTRLAFILCPPPDYQTVLAGLHATALERIRAILEMPLTKDVYNKDGDIVGTTANTAVAGVVLKAYQMLDVRLKGSVVQRVQQQSISLQMKGRGAVAGGMLPDMSADLLDVRSIDAKIRELEQTVGRVALPVLGVSDKSADSLLDDDDVDSDDSADIFEG